MPTVGVGDPVGGKVFRKFTSRDAGVPFTLAGSPVVSCYKNASTTESTAGVTLVADFDGVTGLNHVTVDTSADTTFYAAGQHYELVVTNGTVNGTSVVGEDVGSFDLVVPGSSEVVRSSTAQGGTSTTITLDSGASAADNTYQFDQVTITGGTGAGQSRFVTAYVGSTKVATVDTTWSTTPDATSQYVIGPTVQSQVVSYLAGQDPATLVLDAFATASDAVVASPTPSTTTFAGSSGLSSTSSFYNSGVVFFTSGSLDGLARKVTAYAGGSRQFTVGVALPSAPTAGDKFRVIGFAS